MAFFHQHSLACEPADREWNFWNWELEEIYPHLLKFVSDFVWMYIMPELLGSHLTEFALKESHWKEKLIATRTGSRV